jgi:hypothetical protein
MTKWEYDITSYSIEQVLALRRELGQAADDERPVMFCTDEGACFFDNMPNPNIRAIQQILNGKGAEGWQLVSVSFRTEEMVCFWKREVTEP